MTKLHPYVFFNGNCREAMTFYKECTGGELFIQNVGDSPMAKDMSAEMHSQVLHSSLTLDGETLLFASDSLDMTPSGEPGNMINLCVVCKSPEEIKSFYEKLSAGGTAGHELREEFFGTFGDFIDKYGVRWMLQYAPQNA